MRIFDGTLIRKTTLYFATGLVLACATMAQTSPESLLSTDNAYNPIPSPDGKYIAYVRTGWGEKVFFSFGRSSLVSDVNVVNIEGFPNARTLAKDYFLSGWTSDSTSVVCYRDWKYIVVSAEGKQTLNGKIPNDPEHMESAAEWVAYAPSLESIVWSRWLDKSHRAIETPGRIVVKEKTLGKERVVPSPDGRYFAVFHERPQTDLRIYDLVLKSWTDLGTITIHPDTDWSYIQPSWSPWSADGSRLLFLSGSTLVITSPDGERNEEIEVREHAGLPVASPDGQKVAYVTFEPRPMKTRPDLQFWGGTTIMVTSAIAGSTPRPVTMKNPDEVYDLKWLGNDTLVFDRVADEGFYKQARIWKVPVPR